ncbi:hypothetical protein Tco_1007951 [Tanacetum coccineum]
MPRMGWGELSEEQSLKSPDQARKVDYVLWERKSVMWGTLAIDKDTILGLERSDDRISEALLFGLLRTPLSQIITEATRSSNPTEDLKNEGIRAGFCEIPRRLYSNKDGINAADGGNKRRVEQISGLPSRRKKEGNATQQHIDEKKTLAKDQRAIMLKDGTLRLHTSRSNWPAPKVKEQGLIPPAPIDTIAKKRAIWHGLLWYNPQPLDHNRVALLLEIPQLTTLLSFPVPNIVLLHV